MSQYRGILVSVFAYLGKGIVDKQPLKPIIKKYGISVKQLKTMLQVDRIEINQSGELFVDENMIAPFLEKRQNSRFSNLEGIQISIREASRKYNIPAPTISRWINKYDGIIRVIGREGRKVFIDESDIAYAASVYHANPGQGKWIFDRDGKPYIAQ